jgi:hypothetical protein
MYVDSLDKIIFSYFSTVTREPFSYRGKSVDPSPLRVSPGIFRGYTCPAGCGGCCPRFSLVYLPQETRPLANSHAERVVEFSGRSVVVYEDRQDDHNRHHCRNLEMETGRCKIHSARPFSCDFELIRATIQRNRNLLDTRAFGRAWALKRVDGERGALCTITPADDDSKADAVRKLKRLLEWTNHFGLETWLDTHIIPWVERGPHSAPLVLDPKNPGLF